MQAFMLYMSGGGVQIFSMGIVFMLLSSPFKNLATMNTGASRRFPLARVPVLSESAHPGSSVRPLRAECSASEGVLDAGLAEGRVYPVQHSHVGPWFVEMPVDGPSADGHRRLARV